jgi:hypothetical protein
MFRFTIRDVLWLTVVVALSTAWCVDNYRKREHIDRLYEELARDAKKVPVSITWQSNDPSYRPPPIPKRP